MKKIEMILSILGTIGPIAIATVLCIVGVVNAHWQCIMWAGFTLIAYALLFIEEKFGDQILNWIESKIGTHQ